MLTHFDILTLFPAFFDSYLQQSLVGKALAQNFFKVGLHQLRDWSKDPHRRVDDLPYGGGEGMVLGPEPLTDAIESISKPYKKGRVVYLTCQGRPLNQSYAKHLHETYEEVLLVCGRYEGIDQRVIDTVIDEEVSIGDYVLAGGEAAALVVMDVLIRLIPGVVGKLDSVTEESFETGLLEYPQYTRPEMFRGLSVPEVLLSGHHAQIRDWRLNQSIKKTSRVRPDLIEKGEWKGEILKKIMKLKEV